MYIADIMKTCFKCHQVKPLSEFYKHAKMADGHLNKCKDCTKADVNKDYEINSKNPEWIENERTRGRNKYHRLYSGTGKANPKVNKKYIERYPEKRVAHLKSQNLKLPPGKEDRHHWSYLPEHVKDVFFLTKREHGKIHRFLVYDPERLLYRRFDTNELLDNREKHEIFIKWVLENKED